MVCVETAQSGEGGGRVLDIMGGGGFRFCRGAFRGQESTTLIEAPFGRCLVGVVAYFLRSSNVSPGTRLRSTLVHAPEPINIHSCALRAAHCKNVTKNKQNYNTRTAVPEKKKKKKTVVARLRKLKNRPGKNGPKEQCNHRTPIPPPWG